MNEPHGWSGPKTMTCRDPRPPLLTPVVYFLKDDSGAVVYVGSTQRFMNRIGEHRRKKQFSTWFAIPCSSRDEAYALEMKCILELQPPLNDAFEGVRLARLVRTSVTHREASDLTPA